MEKWPVGYPRDRMVWLRDERPGGEVGCVSQPGARSGSPVALEKLQKAGADVGVVSTLDRIINAHGLVELRSTLTNIVSRLESTNFRDRCVWEESVREESSLLNRILEQDVLPVGRESSHVVPTRICVMVRRRAVWPGSRVEARSSSRLSGCRRNW